MSDYLTKRGSRKLGSLSLHEQGAEVKALVQNILNIDARPLEKYMLLQAIESAAKKARDAIYDSALKDAGDDDPVNVVYRETYTYDHIPQWAKLKARMKAIEEKARAGHAYAMTHGGKLRKGEIAALKKSAGKASIKLK